MRDLPSMLDDELDNQGRQNQPGQCTAQTLAINLSFDTAKLANESSRNRILPPNQATDGRY